MKKIILALSCCVLPLMAENHKADAAATATEQQDAAPAKKSAKKAKKEVMTLETRAEALKAAIAEHKESADLFKALNDKALAGQTKTNYTVCYTKDGDKFTAEVHPKKEYRGEVSKKEVLDLLPGFFDNADKGVHEYEYNSHKKRAIVSKVGENSVCAVTEAVKAEKKAKHKADHKDAKADHKDGAKEEHKDAAEPAKEEAKKD